MNDPKSPNTTGTSLSNGEPVDPIAELRKRHQEAIQGGPGTGRGVKPGTKRGPYKKNAGQPGPSPAPAIPAAGIQPAANESLNKKMGQVWRTVGYGLALGTDCNVWFLDAEQERLLGEAYGDLCAHFGLADTLAFKIVFCVGTTVGIMGAKAALFASFRASQRVKQEKDNKDLKAAPPETPKAPPEVHESKPGTI